MSELILYTTDDGLIKINVQLEEDTVWLTQKQLVELYQTAKSTVSEHIKNIYSNDELQPAATVRKYRTVQKKVKKINKLDESSVVRKFRTTAADYKDYLKAILIG